MTNAGGSLFRNFSGPREDFSASWRLVLFQQKAIFQVQFFSRARGKKWTRIYFTWTGSASARCWQPLLCSPLSSNGHYPSYSVPAIWQQRFRDHLAHASRRRPLAGCRIFDRSKALTLRHQGKSLHEIATELGIGQDTVPAALPTDSSLTQHLPHVTS